jgi:surfeit locus 1 family protein
MEYRQVVVRGIYDHSQEIAIRNQHWQNQWGAHLVTPLIIEGTDQAILVDRGWIPAEDFESGNWIKYAEPGIVDVRGIIRASKQKADFGGRSDPTPAPGENGWKSWNFVNVAGISTQVSLPLLPAYIQQSPDSSWEGPPYRSQPKLDLTEGSHQSYAIQWFTFSLIAAVGYPLYLYRRHKRLNQIVNTNALNNLEGSGDQTVYS